MKEKTEAREACIRIEVSVPTHSSTRGLKYPFLRAGLDASFKVDCIKLAPKYPCPILYV